LDGSRESIDSSKSIQSLGIEGSKVAEEEMARSICSTVYC